MSWFEVRLAFPDGACVDALAVVSEGSVCVEDVRARPALTREDLIALNDWIQRPLLDACGGAARGAVTAGGGPAEGDGPPPAPEREGQEAGGVPTVKTPVTEEPAADRVEVRSAGEAPVAAEPLVAEVTAETADAVEVPRFVAERCASAPSDSAASSSPAASVTSVTSVTSAGPAVGSAGSRRARPGWPRGAEGRRLAAREYRAAQEEGADPVLAVMCATGRSRRRSLRLIAQARDAGYLTSRHVRR
jgi:hypothetical protein